MTKKEIIPSPDTSPSQREIEASPETNLFDCEISGGDLIDVRGYMLAAYEDELLEIHPKTKHVNVFVGELKAPPEKIPRDVSVNVFASTIERAGAQDLHIAIRHPEEISEEDIRWIFGHVLPRAMGVQRKSVFEAKDFASKDVVKERRRKADEALEDFLRARRFEQMGRILNSHIQDPGMHSIYSAVLNACEAFPQGSSLLLRNIDSSPSFCVARDLGASIPIIFGIYNPGAIEGFQFRAEELSRLWKGLSEEERTKLRKEIYAMFKPVMYSDSDSDE